MKEACFMETASYWEIRLYRLRFCRRRFECSFLSNSGTRTAEWRATTNSCTHRRKSAPPKSESPSHQKAGPKPSSPGIEANRWRKFRPTPKSVAQEGERSGVGGIDDDASDDQ